MKEHMKKFILISSLLITLFSFNQAFSQDTLGTIKGTQYFGRAVELSENGNYLAVTTDDSIYFYELAVSARILEPGTGVRVLTETLNPQFSWTYGSQWVELSSYSTGDIVSKMVTTPNFDKVVISSMNLDFINGSTPGKIRIYNNDEQQFENETTFTGGTDTNYGLSISISEDGTILAVSEPRNDKGHILIYRKESGVWNSTPDTVYSNNENDSFCGYKTTLSGNGQVLAFSCLGQTSLNENSFVHILRWNETDSTWNSEKRLTNNVPVTSFGYDIEMSSDGNVIAISAQEVRPSQFTDDDGKIYFFEYRANITDWVARPDGDRLSGQGYIIDLSSDGKTLLMSEPSGWFSLGQSKVYNWITENNAFVWQQLDNVMVGTGYSSFDRLGATNSLSADGSIIALGSTCFQCEYVKTYGIEDKDPFYRTVQYEIQVSTDSTFESVDFQAQNIDSTEYQFTEMVENDTYHFWRVRSLSNGNYGPWSDIKRFSTYVSPGVTTLNSPQNEESLVEKVNDFVWEKENFSEQYNVQISSDEFDTFVIDTLVTDTTFNVELTSNNVSFVWRVKGINTVNEGEWSDSWSFTTNFSPLEVPETLIPFENQENVGTLAEFKWAATEDAIGYDLQISTDSLFTGTVTGIDNIDSTSITLPAPLSQNTAYFWRIRSLSEDETLHSSWSTPLKFSTGVRTNIETEGIPREFRLLQNYPNPFNPSTQIDFELPSSMDVKLEVFNILGQKIAVLVNTKLNAGAYSFEFNAASQTAQLSSGVYLYRLTTSEFSQTRMMNLAK